MDIEACYSVFSEMTCKCGGSFSTPKISSGPGVELLEELESEFLRSERELAEDGERLTDRESAMVECRCSDCQREWKGEVLETENHIGVTLANKQGEEQVALFSKTTQKLRTSTGQEVFELVADLSLSMAVLERFWERIESSLHLESEDLVGNGRLSRDTILDINTDVKGYLAEVYSFKNTFETIKRQTPEGAQLKSIYDTYNDRSKLLLGLRAYIQHERNLNIVLKMDHQADGGCILTPTVNIADVMVMESQITEENEDGYDHDDGADHHYRGVRDGDIDLWEEIDSHKKFTQDAFRNIEETLFSEDSEVHNEIVDWMKLVQKSPYNPLVRNL